jgi:hypothetical protein
MEQVLLDDRDCVEQEGSGFISNPMFPIELLHNMDLRDQVMKECHRAFVDNDNVSHY